MLPTAARLGQEDPPLSPRVEDARTSHLATSFEQVFNNFGPGGLFGMGRPGTCFCCLASVRATRHTHGAGVAAPAPPGGGVRTSMGRPRPPCSMAAKFDGFGPFGRAAALLNGGQIWRSWAIVWPGWARFGPCWAMFNRHTGAILVLCWHDTGAIPVLHYALRGQSGSGVRLQRRRQPTPPRKTPCRPEPVKRGGAGPMLDAVW